MAIVGSGPGCLDNEPGFIDSFDVVTRISNFKLSPETGARTDVFYSFFGDSIRKSAEDLRRHGVTLCMCKCPDAHAIQSRWHELNNRMKGVDFRYIYERRRNWWFCDTYIPDTAAFLQKFETLGNHVPTTGFAAVLDILSFDPAHVYLTGFDFFRSGIHNVNERWVFRNADDPIAHAPERELQWLRDHAPRHPITFDKRLNWIMQNGDAQLPVLIDEFMARAVAIGGETIFRRSALKVANGAEHIEFILRGGRRHIVEIGTFRGVSTAFLARFASRVTTIDLRNGQAERLYPKHSRRGFWTGMGANNIDLHLVRSDEEKGALLAGIDFDFAFIDGDHRMPQVGHDFDMVKRCGTVLFHDFDPDHPNGVTEFVKTLPSSEVEVMGIFALWRGRA